MRKTVQLSPQQEAQQRQENMQSVLVQIECDQTELQGAKHCEMRILISTITDTRGAKLSAGSRHHLWVQVWIKEQAEGAAGCTHVC